jgi:hypothetical protein
MLKALLYAFDAKKHRFTIEVNGVDYTFKFVDGVGKNFRVAETNRLVANTYKGFRDRLGVTGGSHDANTLVTEIRKAAKHLEAQAYQLKREVTTQIIEQNNSTFMTWKHDETQYAAMPLSATLQDLLAPEPTAYGATRETAIDNLPKTIS